MNKESENKTTFGIVGSGWRSEFYLRIAQALPERFGICGLVTRSEETGKAIEQKFGVKTFRSAAEMLGGTAPDFVAVSVPGEATPGVIKELAGLGVPVLTETPPATDPEGLRRLAALSEKGAKIQVAEQYQFQPIHAARIALAASGRLGEPSYAQVSYSHGYHGMSMIRKLLGIGYENATVGGVRSVSPVVEGPGRKGLPERERIVEVPHDLAVLDFGGKTALYDFAVNQHRSFIRSQRILVRGSRGEISNLEVRLLKDFRTPLEFRLLLRYEGMNGLADGYCIRGVLALDEWIYSNPFIPARLSEDEIAVATCLKKMGEYVRGGPEFYGIPEAAQDCCLAMAVNRAIETGEKVRTETQPWAR